MTTIAHQSSSTQTTKAFLAVWSAMGENDDGAPLMGAQYTDKSVQVSGTFGGASVVFEGSNDGTNWATLTDPQGNALTIPAAKIEMISEATWYVRPRVSGGDVTTSLNVVVLMKE
ncbi:MAG TPA: hypothetical protein PK752_03225 [Accumulibacter sp.]|jgi:hypothetical protein|uniref:hypothetical protein n=1 Tax=Accumulibacter sp. TaxID=2053492 RepID=UPI002BA08E74|nr:hypothetical protein [Accumulibacter sp.]HRD87260.1 hypothetical protein [Accumulibacter sp.]